MKSTQTRPSILIVLACGIFTICPVFTIKALAQNEARESTTDADQTELNEKLANYLTGTRWEGHFTVTGEDTPPKKEHYEIIKAEKADKGDFWNLVVRIKYGENDLTQPLPPIEIKWAGRTPVITVDKVTVPTLGTFDARVVIRKGANGQPGKYAGTWSHGNVGGHLFGTISKIEDDKTKAGDENKQPAEEEDPKSKQIE